MKIDPELQEKVKTLLALRTSKDLSTHLGIELIEIHKNKLIGKMPVDQRTKQPFGILHGGASVVLAETLASIGGRLVLPDPNQAVVGIEINANHIKSVKEGFVIGTATPLHLGKKTQIWEIKICDEAENLVCISRCTLMVLA
jgi:1,4-dihydroxy-2-naphthoyl-CoA hydrolase